MSSEAGARLGSSRDRGVPSWDTQEGAPGGLTGTLAGNEHVALTGDPCWLCFFEAAHPQVLETGLRQHRDRLEGQRSRTQGWAQREAVLLDERAPAACVHQSPVKCEQGLSAEKGEVYRLREWRHAWGHR